MKLNHYATASLSAISALILLTIAFSGPTARAEEWPGQGPILDPRTGSYFEIVDRRDVHYQGANWREANKLAAQKKYQDRIGRLAVVADPETLNFVKSKFNLQFETWIGLRYFCRFRKLLWTTGNVQPLKPMATMWAPQWHRTNITCDTQTDMEYMPVYITRSSEGPSTIQASGIEKRMYYSLIEYPKPAENAKAAKQ
jgi:hypothetical protein